MEPGDKALLLKDLCARLPYNVEVEYNNINCEVLSIDKYNETLTIRLCPGYCPIVRLENVKPYLFPLSSMTEEQKREYNSLRNFVPTYHYEFGDIVEDTELFDNYESIDYLISNNFDIYGLIPIGLANDATGLNIY